MAKNNSLPEQAPLMRIGFSSAVFLVLIGSAWAGPKRTLSDPRAIPPSAALIVSIPDLPGAWKALSETVVYADAAALFRGPNLPGVPPVQEMLAEKRQMEAALGFPLDASTLPAIIAGVDFAFLPPPAKDGQTAALFVFRVSDAVRFRRIFEQVEQRMGVAAQRRDAPVERTEYKGIKIVATRAGIGLAIAELTAARFVLANHAEAIRRVVDQTQSKNAVDGQARFRGAVGGLGEMEPHGFFYLNTSRALPALSMLGLGRFARDDLALAVAVRIERDAIRLESFLPFGDPARDPLSAIYRHYPPGRLRSLDYVSSAPVALMARNTLDGPMLHDVIRATALGSLRAAGPPGGNPELRLQRAEEEFRGAMGFSLREDLAASVGPEFFAGLESVGFDPLQILPSFDLVAGVQVRDADGMRRVQAGFESFMEKNFGNDGPVMRPAAFQVSDYRGRVVKSFPFPPMPLYSIAYARTDDFLLLGLGADSLSRAMDRVDGRRRAFSSGMLYAGLKPYLHDRSNEILVFNVPKIAAAGREIIRRLPKTDPEQAESLAQIEFLIARLGRIAAIGASSAGSEGGLQTRGAVVLAAPPPRKTKDEGQKTRDKK